MPDRWRRRLLIAGGLLLVVFVSIAVALNIKYKQPSPAARATQQSLQCARNIGHLASALLAWAEKHGEGHLYPPSLDALVDQGLIGSEKLLICPAHPKPFRTPKGRETSYRYRGGLSLLMPSETVLLTERGAPHAKPPAAVGHGLQTDLRGLGFTDGVEGWADRQNTALKLAHGSNTGLLATELSQGQAFDREIAAWRLWRLRPPGSAPLLKRLKLSLEDQDPEVRLYAGLTLLELGHSDGMTTILQTLKLTLPRARGGNFLVDGPRRRFILHRLTTDKRTRPVRLFAYDSLPAQLEALERWLNIWKAS